MPPPPIPAPLPPWAKVLLQVLPFIPTIYQQALDFIQDMTASDQATVDEWRRFAYHFKNSGSTESADDAVTTFDVVNITGGTIDSSWTDADYQAVDTQLTSLVSAYAPLMTPQAKCFEVKAYRMAFRPLSDPKPFVLSGPPLFMAAKNIPGTGTGIQAPQVAITHTEKTAYPKHWGRNYWPFPAASTVENSGHLADAFVTSLGAAVNAWYGELQVREFFPVVPVTQVNKTPARGLLTVNALQVDDVFDVIRRRRLKHRSLVALAERGEVVTLAS